MKAGDIVKAFQEKLPFLVDDFTSNISILSANIGTYNGVVTRVTIVTDGAHNLTAGKTSFITGVSEPVLILSIVRNGIVGIVTTSTPHDLTNNSQDDVILSGANEEEFSGSFQFYDVSDRYTFRIVMDDSGPTNATGTLYGNNIGNPSRALSGEQEVVEVISATSFEYAVPFQITSEPVLNDATCKGSPRITDSVSIERFLQAYTKELTSAAWLVVVLGDAIANKSRREDTDAVSNIQKSHYFNAKLNQTVEVFVVLPSSHVIDGVSIRDRCEELLKPICQCILLKKFDGLLSNKDSNPLQIIGHGAEQYQTAYYVHRYSFESVVQMLFDDTVGYDEDVAFRDISLTQNSTTGNNSMISNINLDNDVPQSE